MSKNPFSTADSRKRVLPTRSGLISKQLIDDAGGAVNITVAKIPLGRTALVKVKLFGKDTAGNVAIYELAGAFSNKAGVVAAVGTVATPVAYENIAGWTAVIVANDTKDAVDVTFTPSGANDIAVSGSYTVDLF